MKKATRILNIIFMLLLAIVTFTQSTFAWLSSFKKYEKGADFSASDNVVCDELVYWQYNETNSAWETPAVVKTEMVGYKLPEVEISEETTSTGTKTVLNFDSLHFGTVDNLAIEREENTIYFRMKFNSEQHGGEKIALSVYMDKDTQFSLYKYDFNNGSVEESAQGYAQELGEIYEFLKETPLLKYSYAFSHEAYEPGTPGIENLEFVEGSNILREDPALINGVRVEKNQAECYTETNPDRYIYIKMSLSLEGCTYVSQHLYSAMPCTLLMGVVIEAEVY